LTITEKYRLNIRKLG